MELKQKFASKKLTLVRKEETKDFLLRPYQQGDENGIIECIRSEYADTYFKRDFYNPEILKQKATGDQYRFFVACIEKRIVAMLIFTLFTNEVDNYLEPASEIISQEARGYGLAERFVEYTFPYAKAMQPNCLFVHAVTFHDITQRICEKEGMIPCGFRLGTFLVDCNKNSYQKKRCIKQSEGILVLSVAKKSIGDAYFPEEIASFVKEIYTKLGVKYQIHTNCEIDFTRTTEDDDKNEHCELVYKDDIIQRNCLIQIKKHGSYLQEELMKLIQSHKEPYWTYQLTMDADSEMVYQEYEQAKAVGFFFAGLKPLCGKKEQFFVQWTGELELYMEDYCLTEQFINIKERIQSYYEKRIRVKW